MRSPQSTSAHPSPPVSTGSGEGGWAPGADCAGARRSAQGWLTCPTEQLPQPLLRSVPGRETFAADGADAPSGFSDRPVIVKRFVGRLTGERWYRRCWRPDRRSPGQREFDSLVELSRRGVLVPRPIGWWRCGDRSLVVMQRVPHTSTLREALKTHPQEWCLRRQSLLELVLRLHAPAAGHPAAHRDLYLQHLLLAGEDRSLCLIDVGRLLVRPKLRRRWLEKDLAALALSCPDAVGPVARLAWLSAYLQRKGPRLPRAQQRQRLFAWARRIEARRARMAAHRPRFGEEEVPAPVSSARIQGP